MGNDVLSVKDADAPDSACSQGLFRRSASALPAKRGMEQDPRVHNSVTAQKLASIFFAAPLCSAAWLGQGGT